MSNLENRVQRLEQVYCPEMKHTVQYAYGMFSSDVWYAKNEDGTMTEITDKRQRNITYLSDLDIGV